MTIPAHSAPPRFNDQVRGWLQPALDLAATHDIEDIERGVLDGRFQLWIGPDGAAITEILVYPKKKVLHVFLAGGSKEQIIDFQASAMAWGQAHGCSEMNISGRKGWLRALSGHGWKEAGAMMRLTP